MLARGNCERLSSKRDVENSPGGRSLKEGSTTHVDFRCCQSQASPLRDSVNPFSVSLGDPNLMRSLTLKAAQEYRTNVVVNKLVTVTVSLTR